MLKKHPKADLRSYHTLFTEIGIIVALLFMIAATNADLKSKKSDPDPPQPDPDIEVIDLPPTTPPDNPPAPIKPSVLIPVPNDEPIDEPSLEFPEFDIGGNNFALPDPPSDETNEDNIVEFLEFMPEIKGGLNELYSKINYPKAAQVAGIEGRVAVEFIVNDKGEVTNPRIIRSIGGGCDEEVLRVIKLMKFTPGIQNGRFVKVRMRQSVKFELQN
jgi:protein TonB